PVREAGRHHHGCRRSTRDRHRPKHRRRVRAPPGGARRRLCMAPRPHRRGPRLRPGRQAPRRAGLMGPDDRAPLAMRVVYYSPLPPDRSGIADYSAHLLPALEDRLDVVVARRGRLRRARRADVALYHVGNDPQMHGWIVDALRRRPGVVVLHEFVLHHLVSGITLARGDVEGYLAALEREAGPAGRERGQAVQQGRIEPLWESRPQDFPLAAEVLDLATGLIVHSRYVEDRVRDVGYRGPIWRIPMAAWPLPAVEPAHVEGEPLFGCFGHINE